MQIVWTYDQNALTLYLDGRPLATNFVGAHTMATSSNNLRISGDDNGNVMFNGSIEDVRYYNRALLQNEITTIFDGTSAGTCSPGSVVPPTIARQPQSQVVTNAANVTFTATATGTAPLSYQWEFNGGTIAGATNVALTLTNVQPVNAGQYSVVVTNVAGSATSSNALLTVNVPPSITQQPQNQIVTSGATATFAVSATGTAPLAYQW